MKKYLFLAVLMLIGAANMNAASPKKKAKVTPEMKGVASINRSTAEAHVGFLACDELEGREAGWKGGRIAGNYIISCLKQMCSRSKLITLNAKREASVGKYIQTPSPS